MSPVLFQEIVAELVEDMQSDLKFDSLALEALQEVAEGYIVSMFRGRFARLPTRHATYSYLSDINLCDKQANRVTVMLDDLLLAGMVKGRYRNSDTNSPRALKRARLEQQSGHPAHPASS